MALPKNLEGQKFGRLTPLEYEGASKWRCKCDCGVVKSMSAKRMLNGTARSCGCLHKEELAARRRTHGMTGSPTYIIWTNMKARCLNESAPYYKNYGGRGIKVCDRWKDSFENFLEDMGERPEGLTLERIDSNGNYEPSNCKWDNWTNQMNNRRVNRKVTYDGRTQTIAQWSREVGVDPSVIRNRLNSGASPEKALGAKA